MSGTMFFFLFNTSHSSSTNCYEVMSKRTQERRRRRRKSHSKIQSLWRNLISRCRLKDPTMLASTACENPVNTKSESQKVPLSALSVQQSGMGKPIMLASSSNFVRMEQWREVVFSSAKIQWIVEKKNEETSTQRVGHRYWYGLWHRHRIEPFS